VKHFNTFVSVKFDFEEEKNKRVDVTKKTWHHDSCARVRSEEIDTEL